jgi:PPOX class probable F420-dependent enzyme
MERDAVRAAVAAARVARLATQTKTGRVDLVPITFALVDDRLVTAIDHKPKTTTQLKRLDNIRANPEVSVLVDHYDEDWAKLWWVRLRGVATVVEREDAPPAPGLHDEAVGALVDKYPQYRDRPLAGDVIVVELVRWQWWSAEEAGAG